LATRELAHIELVTAAFDVGAGGRIRTPDLLITNQLLYRLSYTSTSTGDDYHNKPDRVCQQLNWHYSEKI
jgi:hypothetical protein